MSHNLFLGFRQEPEDLDSSLTRLGFRYVGRHPQFPETGRYVFSGRCPITFTYSASMNEDDRDFWKKIDPNVVAVGDIVARGDEDSSDLRQQFEIARTLRDQYGAVLVDPQKPIELAIISD